MPKLIGRWTPTRELFETPAVDLFTGLSEPYSEPWPTSGMTRSGMAYELLTRELPTAASESSSAPSLLPTPAAANPNEDERLETWTARRERVREALGNGNGFGMPLGIAVRLLLPTPTTSASTGAWEPPTGGPNLQMAIARLRSAPTPPPSPTGRP